MWRIIWIGLVFLINDSTLFAQSSRLTYKLKTADSVLLIRHKNIPGASVQVIDSAGREISFPLMVSGKLNPQTVVQRISLDSNDISKLATILSYRKDNQIELTKCFNPHHAIILIKDGRFSYIDLCFACEMFTTSSDIHLIEIEKKTWKKLHDFFKARKIDVDVPDF